MSTLYYSVLAALLLLWSFGACAKDGYATHIADFDNVENEGVAEGLSTRYTALIDGTAGEGVVDEVYLRLEYKPGFEPDPDGFMELSCGELVVDIEAVKRRRSGRDLIVSYGFVDLGEEYHVPEVNCWSFVVDGVSPIQGVEAVVTYHGEGPDKMPDLYDAEGKFPGDNRLFVTNADTVLAPQECVGAGGVGSDLQQNELSSDARKLVVLIHGWNPSGQDNAFAPAGHFEIDNSWVRMCVSLIENERLVAEGWEIARYDWSRDADTGSIFDIVPPGVTIENPNNARDAAHVHGLKLGWLLAYPNGDRALEARELESVHFIAHSAGNWTARRAAEYLRFLYGDRISIKVTSLDAFVNDADTDQQEGYDLDLEPNFESTTLWTDYLENFFVIDYPSFNPLTPGSDYLGWTSGSLLGWDRNLNIETLGRNKLYIPEIMDEHGGPVLWYAGTTVGAVSVAMSVNPEPVRIGERLYFRMLGRNWSDSPIDGVSVEAPVPVGTEVSEGFTRPNGDCTGTANSTCGSARSIKWRLDTIESGGNTELLMPAKVLSGGGDGTVIGGRASIYSMASAPGRMSRRLWTKTHGFAWSWMRLRVRSSRALRSSTRWFMAIGPGWRRRLRSCGRRHRQGRSSSRRATAARSLGTR